jgi:type IV pilus assembly protein PilM
MTLLARWLASPPPDAAIEIAADRVAAVAVSMRSDGPAVSGYASEALRPGVVTPSLTGTNVADRHAVVGAIRRVLEKLGGRTRRVALVIPDTAVKVSLLRFDNVPARRDDFEQLVRWQLRKAAPFPVESAAVTSSPAMALADGGREFLVELARQECIREYESVCEDAGLYAGLIDTATISLLGLIGGNSGADGDWLLVHVRPDYTSIAIVRDGAIIFYRNRSEDGQETVADLVHQTSMYYQDRLSGGRFARAYLAGAGRVAGSTADREAIEERLGVPIEPIESAHAPAFANRIAATADLVDLVGPPVGILRRTYNEAGA